MKRWLTAHADDYKWLKPTILGDDAEVMFRNFRIIRYVKHLCYAILEAGMSFILTCKPKSHPWLTETVENSIPEEFTVTEWNGRYHLYYTYKWVNGVEIRDDKETLLVNFMSLEIKNDGKNKHPYKNSWITNKTITKDNVRQLTSCGRARWKIENEHNNVLKNHGYNLKHNFGHGQEYAGMIFCLLNLLAFQFHTILHLCDERYKKLRVLIGRRDEFFNVLRASLRFGPHESWDSFLIFALAEDDPVPSG